MQSILVEVLGEACGIGLMAFALSLLNRTLGAFVLEVVVLATCTALYVGSFYGEGATASYQDISLFGWAIAAFVLLLSMPIFYRLLRPARGGDTTSLIVSFALMNGLILGCIRATEGRSLSFVSSSPMNSVLLLSLGVAVSLVVYLLSNDKRFQALSRLARSNEPFLAVLGFSAAKIRCGAILICTLFFFLGALLFISLQENFKVASYESFLIVVFGISICQLTPSFAKTLFLAALLVTIDEMFRYLGPPVMKGFFQSAILLLLIVTSSYRELTTNIDRRVRG